MIELPWPPEALNPNGGKNHHWGKHHSAFKQYKAYVSNMAKKMPPSKNLKIIFHPRRKDQDKDNAIAWFKAGQDGLADAWGMNDNEFNIVWGMAEKGSRSNPRVLVEAA